MNSKSPRRLWRIAATGIATAVVALSLGSVPAMAAPIIDESTGSITVHKFERPGTPTALPNNGTEVTVPTDLVPLPGIGFDIAPVTGIDLTTNAGWQSANALSGTFDAADPAGSITAGGFGLGTPERGITGTDGIAVFDELDLGLYLVTETVYPAGVTPSAPFLITVPLTDPLDRDTWIYDVHVYPKNSTSNINVSVVDLNAVKLGDNVVFNISADIPNEAVIDGYRITDQLNPNLAYVGAAVTLGNGTIVTENTHFTLVYDPATRTVTVEFNEAGRALLAQNNGTTVDIALTTTVTGVGELENSAALYPNAASFTIAPGEPGGAVVAAPVLTKWGSITWQKVDPDTVALTGASFSVYASEADASTQSNAIELGGETVFSVDAAGLLTLSGLRYSDWVDGEAVAVDDDGYRTYYLVEVEAPEGFELLAAPVPFSITAESSDAAIDDNIVNVPSNGGFELPLTGGSGTALLYGAGALVLVGAALLFVRSRRNSTAGN